MKRLLFSITGLALCGFIVYAIAYSGPLLVEFNPEPVPEAVPPVQVRIALYDWTENLEVKNAIRLYNQSNPDHIEIVLMNLSTDAYDDTLNMLMTSGQGPDVFSVDNSWLATYVNKGYLADLNPYLDSGDLNRFPQWARDYARSSLFKGGVYFMPSSIETVRLIYNKQLFRNAGLNADQPPVTFTELKQAAAGISQAGAGVNKYGFALAGGDSQDSLQTGLEMSNTYSGVYLYNYRTGRYNLSVYAPWLQLLLEMKAAGSLYPGETLLKRNAALRQFADGNIGMMYATSKDYVKLQEYMPKDDWGVALPPVTSLQRKGSGALMMIPHSPLAVNSSAPDREAAVKVWKFLQSEDFLAILFQQALALPVVDGITDLPVQIPGLGHFKDFYPTAEESIYPLIPQIMDQYDPNTVSVEPRDSGDRPRMQLYLQILSGGISVDEGLRAESARLNQMLDIAATGYSFKYNEYIYPDFDPNFPLREESLESRLSAGQEQEK
ncbi:ABC transporter substrate-binding protein [Paenibacillus sp. S150]|uniref:ABC transporter substrate-binding protein n=1 Tax=Paenibacillus sp. S150 TaxID=2749826 RepID=UPI001C5796F9|nr:extracellular solute-binding protein [Paenibacillus sp. S150]MBW4084760.1 extracellular solute-binding protein [Paenibacillus sp. S150]